MLLLRQWQGPPAVRDRRTLMLPRLFVQLLGSLSVYVWLHFVLHIELKQLYFVVGLSVSVCKRVLMCGIRKSRSWCRIIIIALVQLEGRSRWQRQGFGSLKQLSGRSDREQVDLTGLLFCFSFILESFEFDTIYTSAQLESRSRWQRQELRVSQNMVESDHCRKKFPMKSGIFDRKAISCSNSAFSLKSILDKSDSILCFMQAIPHSYHLEVAHSELSQAPVHISSQLPHQYIPQGSAYFRVGSPVSSRAIESTGISTS
jgi:hypothetical protein